MQNLLKNKLFIILLIFILLIGISSSCFAFEFTSSDNMVFNFEIPDGRTDFIFVEFNRNFSSPFNSKYCLVTFDTAFGKIYDYGSDSSLLPLTLRQYNGSEFCLDKINVYRLERNSPNSNILSFSLNFYGTDIDSSFKIVSYYSTLDIYRLYEKTFEVGPLVFQGAPRNKVEEVELTKIAQVEEIPQMMTKVLQMIIPIGLAVLSLGLLIYLIRLVISRLT